MMEWLLMDPARVPRFMENLNYDSAFRKKFVGLLFPVMDAMRTLGSGKVVMPDFYKERVDGLRHNLEEESRHLEALKKEVAAREARVAFLTEMVSNVNKGDVESIFGYESRLPALPNRPRSRRSRKWTKRGAPKDEPERGRKRRRSLSRLPDSGSRRPAEGRATSRERRTSRSRSSRARTGEDRSRPQRPQWPPATASSSRRRSTSRAPSVSAVRREPDEHRSLGRVSKSSVKRSRLSDLLYDTVQEAALEERSVEEERTVRRIDDSPEDDYEKSVIDRALDEQTDDLDLELHVADYSILESD